MAIYSDAEFIQALRNYKRVITEQVYNPGGCKYNSFLGFMLRGVEKYCDAAKPFEMFKIRAETVPKTFGTKWEPPVYGDEAET
jgi:hypothetical protein